MIGMGISGTVFLANLLGRGADCAVYHETPRDRDALVAAYWKSDLAGDYISGSRSRLIASRILLSKAKTYGEVNSYLRYHVDAIQQYWQPTILHLVRDGRDVVRSMMNRKTYTYMDRKHSGQIVPQPDDPWYSQWPTFDRFSKICWYWASANEYLLVRKLPIVRFEDILSSYDLFAEQVLQPLSINISIDVWRHHVQKPLNVSRVSDFPAWDNWTFEQYHQFTTICGPVMEKLGYRM